MLAILLGSLLPETQRGSGAQALLISISSTNSTFCVHIHFVFTYLLRMKLGEAGGAHGQKWLTSDLFSLIFHLSLSSENWKAFIFSSHSYLADTSPISQCTFLFPFQRVFKLKVHSRRSHCIKEGEHTGKHFQMIPPITGGKPFLSEAIKTVILIFIIKWKFVYLVLERIVLT